jgi:phage-related protein
MPRNIPAQVLAQMDATNKRPVLLFEIGLSATLRFAAYKSNITFPTAGNTYTAKAIQISGVSQALEGQIGRITVKFDNVVRDMAAYAHNESFRGKTLIIKRVYLDALGDATYYNEIFNGYMETPSGVSRHWLTVQASSGKPLNRKTLRFPYQKMCPWVFGDTECNTDGNADLSSLTATGTADSGTTSTLVHSALTQVDDFWNNGRITITKSGVSYTRKISDFVAATDTLTLDVELPVAVDGTTTYVLFKGCDQTWDTCSATNVWGPSADNSLNFGGCIHIVKPHYEADTPAPRAVLPMLNVRPPSEPSLPTIPGMPN